MAISKYHLNFAQALRVKIDKKNMVILYKPFIFK